MMQGYNIKIRFDKETEELLRRALMLCDAVHDVRRAIHESSYAKYSSLTLIAAQISSHLSIDIRKALGIE